MTQTLAIFYDAYRSLNAKKMFWIVLIISVLVAATFGCVGINERGLKILTWQWDTGPLLTSETMPPPVFYKFIFGYFGIGWWLAWIAAFLALVSTAGIFPDLITSGSIDLLVSKPIGRLRLFITQYAAGLLFVTLQVTLFTVASFLVIGLRGGAWEPGLLVAIPLVVCFFSYLFSVCVFVGLVTRSTLAALLLTLLFWVFVAAVGTTENVLLVIRTQQKYGTGTPFAMQVEMQDKSDAPQRPAKSDPRATQSADDPRPATDLPTEEDAKGQPRGGKVPRAMARALLKAVAEPSSPEEKGGRKQPLPVATAPRLGGKKQPQPSASPPDGDEGEEGSGKLKLAHNIVYGVKTVLPKTTETIGLLERSLYSMADLPAGMFGQPPQQAEAQREVVEELRSRTVWWVVGTSLGFELFVLAWAAFIFCRRDY